MYTQRGVTLIELLTVMVVIGILTAVAVPSYRQYAIRTTRTDAKTELTSRAQLLERCYTRNFSYNAPACFTDLPAPTSSNTYQISIAFDTTAGAPAGTSYTLTAAPLGAQANDTQCGSFTLTEQGTQAVSSGATSGCW
jgi:type IV pilus assembly protein PilE